MGETQRVAGRSAAKRAYAGLVIPSQVRVTPRMAAQGLARGALSVAYTTFAVVNAGMFAACLALTSHNRYTTMPDILLPVAVSQGQAMPRRVRESDETIEGASEGSNVGFSQLLAALGIDVTRVQGVDLEGQSVFPQGAPQGGAVDLIAMLRGQDLASRPLDSPLQLPPEIAHLVDSKDFDAVLQDLQAFLQQQALPAGPLSPELPTDLDDLDAVSLEAVETDADPLPVDPDVVLDLGRSTQQSPAGEQLASVAQEWVAQLPPDLQTVLARLLTSGNGLPLVAAAAQGAAGEVAAQSPPLQQLLAMLQQGAGNESVSDTPVEEVLTKALAAKSRSGKSPAALAMANPESAAKEKIPELRLAAGGAAGLTDGEAAAPAEQIALRTSVLNLQKALGQGPATSWSAPLTSASGLALHAGATTGSPGSVLLSSPQAPAILTPPGDAAWSQALGERVLWMTGRNMQQAEIRLSPPQLGPVEIRVSVQNDQATVSFTAQHPFTREALEASLPRLREMLGEANLNLADVDVGQRDTGESRAKHWGEPGQGAAGGPGLADGEGEPEAQAVTVARVSNGLVDDFA